MRFPFRYFLNNLLAVFYPHYCEGCGSDVVRDDHFLCARCLHQLPETHFFEAPENPIEKIFYGRLHLQQAGATFYFTKNSLLQHLLVQLKYKGNKESGYFLGRMLGYSLQKTERFNDVDIIVPLPLNKKKEFIRGYNQAEIICKGIQSVWYKPILNKAIERIRFTESQTHQNRASRWQNMEGVFSICDISAIQHKHILLIDDVITTGAH